VSRFFSHFLKQSGIAQREIYYYSIDVKRKSSLITNNAIFEFSLMPSYKILVAKQAKVSVWHAIGPSVHIQGITSVA
jgi:hypothetical protein